ncbi:metallophosphoesterase family protein [Mesorhizobium sp. IMUNJ 23232]|uniref:metallophosphoesterase family protein n=1 Tax=Mesorhizobium sp. IMUNJ 23232 TaxID=3376064 RepID=UPI0037B1484D
MAPLIDPRLGDIEADASSTKRRSFVSLAGSLLAEVSLPKLVAAWAVLLAMPALLLGLTPLVATAWLAAFSHRLSGSYGGLWPFIVVLAVAGLGLFGGRSLRRTAEMGFWSLNSVAVQPAYALFREGVRHLLESTFQSRLDATGRARLRAASAVGAGAILATLALVVIWLIWPSSRWNGKVADLMAPLGLVVPMLANAMVILCGYCAGAALVWGIADARMDQPQDFSGFGKSTPMMRKWRVAHLSDIHTVGERYGFRIESGRSGPRGNERLGAILTKLAAIHAELPLDHILITGDITDAGRSAEWAEFLSALSAYPALAERTLLLPGNHDINVVDRANPARLELPISPGRRLREMRALSGIAAVQAARVRIVDEESSRLGETLDHFLSRHRESIASFADTGGMLVARKLSEVWTKAFPMILPPDEADGLGVILLNSTAQTHFSFTNALGLIPSEQWKSLKLAVRQFPDANWILALHHHLVEYPGLANAFSERIGTALINGSWFVRQLAGLGSRIVVMHGHRHIDWIGHCGALRIISAPSPVMESTGEDTTCFHIHMLGLDENRALTLLPPERVGVPGASLRD